MNYDKLIEDKQIEKQSLVDKMKLKKEEIINELETYSKVWIEDKTISKVKELSDKVLGLGESKARELKEEIAMLIDKLSGVVKENADKKEVWWHQNETNRNYYISSNQALPELDDVARHIFGELGAILIKYNLESKETSEWRRRDGVVEYSYGLIFPQKLCSLSAEYIEMVKEARKINGEIKNLEDRMKRDNIEEWWKSL